MIRLRLPKYEIFRAKGPERTYGLWYWHLVGANGEIQCVSEGYSSRSNARRGAKAARRNSRIAVCKDVY
jgi:uncharacterized protein YegP (UPF0339 family)